MTKLNFDQNNQDCRYRSGQYDMVRIQGLLTLKAPIKTAADDNFHDTFPIFEKNKI